MLPSTRAEVVSGIAAISPDELAERLIEEYEEIIRRFYLGDFRPSELSGGRFGEAVFRICQHVLTQSYTPLGKTLPNADLLLRQFESAAGDDTFRLHIPRSTKTIYDFRNKRDVAHLGKGVSPNLPDAALIVAVASWVVAEIVRVSHKCGTAEAQVIVDGLVQRPVPLVWTEGDLVRVLDPSLDFPTQTLLVLHYFFPNWVSDVDLFRWLEYSKLSSYKSNVLRRLHSRALIHYAGDKAKILPKGIRHIEALLKS